MRCLFLVIFLAVLGDIFLPLSLLAQEPTEDKYRSIQLGENLLQRGKEYQKEGQIDSALYCFEGALKLFDRARHRDGVFLAGIHLADELSKSQNTEELLQKNSIFEDYADQSDSLSVFLHLALAHALIEKGELQKALNKLSYCANTLKGIDFSNAELSYRILSKQAHIFEEISFPKAALGKYDEIWTILEEDPSFISKGELLQNRLAHAESSLQTGQDVKTTNILKEIEEILGLVKKELAADILRMIHERLGKLYLAVKDPQAARKNFKAYETLSSSQELFRPIIWFYKAKVALLEKKHALAEEMLEKALQAFTSQQQEKSPAFLETQLLLAQLYLEGGQVNKSIQANHRFFLAQIPGAEEFEANYFQQVSRSPENYRALSLLAQAKAVTAESVDDPENKLLKESIIAYQQAMQMGDELKQDLHYLEYGLYDSSERRAYYESAIQTALKLAELSDDSRFTGIAFQFQQRKKAEEMREIFAQHFREQGLPWHFEEETERKFNAYKLKQLEEKKHHLVGEDAKLLEKLISQAKEEQNIHLSYLKNTFPSLIAFRDSPDFTDIAELRDQLAPLECLISFFEGKEHYYAFELKANRISHKKIKKNDVLIRSFLKSIEEKNEEILSFQIMAHQLYQELLEEHLKDSTSSLIIIPDGLLHHLPFEILQDHQNKKVENFASLPYLFRKFPLRYLLHSRDLLPNKNSASAYEQEKIGIFFPGLGPGQFRKDSALAHLPSLEALREKLRKRAVLMNAEFFENENANTNSFSVYGYQYKCLEFAGYAFSNDQKSSQLQLHFKNWGKEESLLMSEIFLGDFSNGLILLPFHYRIGEIENGLSIKSLVSSFRYANSNNVVVSLWGASEPAHQISLDEFYQLMYANKGKATSLQKAKLLHLSQNSPYHHPHYWAGLVLYGDNVNMQGEERPWWTYGALGFALFMIFLILFGFRRKRRKR